MGSDNWSGRIALAVLPLSLLGSAAFAQDNSGVQEGSDATPHYAGNDHSGLPRLDDTRDLLTGGSPLLRRARSSTFTWDTGGLTLEGERIRSGSRLANTAHPGSQWQRTYVADARFWQDITPGIAFEAGGHLTRTHSGLVGGPLLTNPTISLAQTAYVGARLGDSSYVRLIGYDNGGWSQSVIGEQASRIANGEAPARRGAAIEIGRFSLQPQGTLPQQQISLRLESGRIAAARSDSAATISWAVHF